MRGFVRATAPGQALMDREDRITFQAGVICRAGAEQRVSWSARMRDALDDMHIVYAGIGAAAATVFCVLVLMSMMRFATHERPDSLAAIVSLLASPKTVVQDENAPGTNKNPVVVDAQMLMLSSLGGVVGDTAVQRAMSEYAKAWKFKHPSPWDYAFFMNNALHRDLGWFWNYWLFTTESVDESIQSVRTTGRTTMVTVRQNGQMPSPVVLKVEFAPASASVRATPGATFVDANTAIIVYPVDVWFAGSRTFTATLDFGGRAITRITLDPNGRFPDRDPSDNVWPRTPAPARPPGGN
jgi:hypothetical protein